MLHYLSNWVFLSISSVWEHILRNIFSSETTSEESNFKQQFKALIFLEAVLATEAM